MEDILLGKIIKRKREKLQMKQQTLANYLQVDQSAISKIENGRQEPTLHQLYILHKVLNLSLDKFFKYLENYKKS